MNFSGQHHCRKYPVPQRCGLPAIARLRHQWVNKSMDTEALLYLFWYSFCLGHPPYKGENAIGISIYIYQGYFPHCRRVTQTRQPSRHKHSHPPARTICLGSNTEEESLGSSLHTP